MNVYEAIMARRSIRKFKPDPVSQDIIKKLLEAARWAPSGGNIQPWFFYVVQDQGKREQLSQAAFGQKHLIEAPITLVICAEPQQSADKYKERGAELYCLQDTAAATENIMLAAVAEGMATCWLGAFDEQKVQQALAMPEGRRPVVMIPVGYPAKEPSGGPARKDLTDLCQWV